MELIRQIRVNRISKDNIGYLMRNFAVDTIMIDWHSQENNIIATYSTPFTFT